MKICVIGLGFVGLSFSSVLASKGYSVIGVDSDKAKVAKILSGRAPFHEPRLDETIMKGLKKDLKITTDISQAVKNCKFIFITVGTPQLHNGSIDLTMVKTVTGSIGSILAETTNKPTIIIKSTVIPQTTKNVVLPILEKKSGKKLGKGFGLVTNPEFLRETKAIEDTISPHVVVLGGDDDEFMKDVKKFYEEFHKKVPIIMTNHQTAEMIKYANNSFLATKISFINQIASICEAIPGSNVEIVAKTIGLDPRIGSLFLNAGPGYGGSCLPKDVKAIINFSSKYKVKPSLLNAVEEVNNEQLERIVNLIQKKIGNVNGKTITILGLAFKADTDDVRDSVSIKLIELLLKKNAHIKAHDPRAIENTKLILGDKINYARSIKAALQDSYCAVILTSWKQYAQITNDDLKNMKKQFVVDSRRLLVGRNLNMDYHAIGIGN